MRHELEGHSRTTSPSKREPPHPSPPSSRYLEKAGPDHALSRASLEDRQAMVEHYIRARAVLGPEALEGPLAPTAEETAEAERICRQLIAKAPEEVAPQEASIRLGDVFALMVEHKHATGDLRGAHALLSEMRQRDLVLAPYIDSKILGEVFAAVGETAPRTDPGMGAGADRFAEDEVESDIEEERVIEESVASDSDEGF